MRRSDNEDRAGAQRVSEASTAGGSGMRNGKNFIVALTGGVASGKSAVASRFALLGVDVVDADVVARALVAPGQPALAEIAAAFGTGVLDDAGALDRRAMRHRVFADADARRTLEAILHSRVRHALLAHAAHAVATYTLLVVPLLIENAAAYAWVDRVAVVDVAPATQRARLLVRDGITPELAESMLAAQATREARLARADDIIDNEGSLTDLYARVDALHARYLVMAADKRGSI